MSMIHVHDIIRARLYAASGLVPRRSEPLTLSDLQRTEWSKSFETLMRNRLIQGALRYGRIHAPGKPTYDRTAAISKRLVQYTNTGNLEFLVDIANLALLEFEEGRHPCRHWATETITHCCP
jgi:hypothetical protein